MEFGAPTRVFGVIDLDRAPAVCTRAFGDDGEDPNPSPERRWAGMRFFKKLSNNPCRRKIFFVDQVLEHTHQRVSNAR